MPILTDYDKTSLDSLLDTGYSSDRKERVEFLHEMKKQDKLLGCLEQIDTFYKTLSKDDGPNFYDDFRPYEHWVAVRLTAFRLACEQVFEDMSGEHGELEQKCEEVLAGLRSEIEQEQNSHAIELLGGQLKRLEAIKAIYGECIKSRDCCLKESEGLPDSAIDDMCKALRFPDLYADSQKGKFIQNMKDRIAGKAVGTRDEGLGQSPQDSPVEATVLQMMAGLRVDDSGEEEVLDPNPI